jgi:ClpP class serine protease
MKLNKTKKNKTKPHSLLRLTSRLHGVPHLVTPQLFNNITAYLSTRNAGMMLLPTDQGDSQEEPDDLDDIMSVGVIDIMGPLTYRTTGWEAECGGCSYEMILESAEDMIEGGVTCIVMRMDSSGGEAYGIFETGNQLRQMCDEADVELIAYVDGMSASACYALACVADEVICNPYGEAGSIGVLISLMDESKALANEGLKPIFISAGDEKIPYAADGSFRQEFLDDLQEKVDVLYDAFAAHVSTYTGLSVADVKATQAKVFMADEAMSLGLVNKIMTNSEFVDYIAGKQLGVSNA